MLNAVPGGFLFRLNSCLSSSPSHDWKQKLPSKQILPLCHIPLRSQHNVFSAACVPQLAAKIALAANPHIVQRKVSYKFNLELKGKAGFLWLVSPLQLRHEWEYWPPFVVELHKPGHILSTGCIFQLNWNNTQPYLISVAEASSSLHPQVLHWFWALISSPELWVIQ